MTDNELIAAVKAYMEQHPHATRTSIRKSLSTSDERLARLEKQGHLRLPKAMTLSQAATMNRRRNNIGANFYISKPAPWQMGRKA